MHPLNHYGPLPNLCQCQRIQPLIPHEHLPGHSPLFYRQRLIDTPFPLTPRVQTQSRSTPFWAPPARKRCWVLTRAAAGSCWVLLGGVGMVLGWCRGGAGWCWLLRVGAHGGVGAHPVRSNSIKSHSPTPAAPLTYVAPHIGAKAQGSRLSSSSLPSQPTGAQTKLPATQTAAAPYHLHAQRELTPRSHRPVTK